MLTQPFGSLKDGRFATLLRLERGEEMQLELLDFGATIRCLKVRDRDGDWVDVVLGYDTIREYEDNGGYFGATIGRHANRIGKSEFVLNGRRYTLARNDGENHLHGGPAGFHRCLWEYEALPDGVRFFRTSPDWEEGYPGALSVSITYRLLPKCVLSILYEAKTDRDTLCNLTNHSYFNLNGSGDILGHGLKIAAEAFLQNDPQCLPTGRVLPVEHTAFDFRLGKPVGRDIEREEEQLSLFGGYDHNFCLDRERALRPVAWLRGERSGILMQLSTTMPGMQIYTSNGMPERRGKRGATHGTHSGICLETQYYPNAMACEGFKKPILRAEERYREETQFQFFRDAGRADG